MVLQERARKAQRAIELARGYSPTPKLLRTLQKRRRKASRRAVRALKRFLRSKPPRAWDEEAKRGVYIGAARWPDGVGRFIGLLTDQSLGDVPPTRGRFVMPGPNPYQLPKPFDPATSPGMTDMMVDPDTLDAFMEANPLPEEAWPGPGDKPHDYSPDYMAMGDCRICGHTEEAHRRDRK